MLPTASVFRRFRLPGGLLGAALAAALSFPPPAAAFIDRGEVVSRALPNGMEVLVREEAASPVVEIQVWVRAGARDERRGQEGIAHLFEHMLFKGTPTRGVGRIAAEVEAAGGDINAWTSHENTVYHATLPAEAFDTGLAVLADAVLHSVFDPAELEREKKVVIEELRQGADLPVRVYQERLWAAAWRVHPYGRKVIGTERSVSSITRDDMLAFFRAWYVPGNMKLVVVGGVPPERVFARAGALFDAPPAPPPPRLEVTEPPLDAVRFARMTADTDPARVTLAFPIGALTAPETPALDLLAAVLSQGESSRLPREVRDRGAALSAWAGAFTPRDPGLFLVGATAEQGKVRGALEALLAQLNRLRSEPVPREELERVRNQLLSDKVYSRQEVEGEAREIGSSAVLTGDPAWSERYFSRLQAVESSDLLTLAREVFLPGRAVAAFLTRDAAGQPGDDEVRSLLAGALSPAKDGDAGAAGAEAVGRGVLRKVLGNGVTVLVREDRRLPLVAVKAGVPGGLRFEEEASNGGFALLAGLLARGTERRTADQLAERLDGMSASLGGFSGRNSFGVEGTFLSRDLAEGVALAAEVLTRASLPPGEVALARDRALAEVRARRDRLPAVAFDAFTSTLYRSHPYRMPVGGTEGSVGGATRERLLALYRGAVRPAGMVVSLCGDLDPAQAFALAEKEFGPLSLANGSLSLPKAEPPLDSVRRTRIPRPGKEQTHLVLGFLGPTLRGEDREAVEVLNAVLAGQGGRLFTELRDKLSLAYSVGSMAVPGVEPGFIAFSLATSPSREKEAVDAFLREIRRVRDQEVPPEELARAVGSLAGSEEVGLQTAGAKADQSFFPALYGQDLARALDHPARVRRVTAAQVREAALRYLDLERYALAVVDATVGGERGN